MAQKGKVSVIQWLFTTNGRSLTIMPEQEAIENKKELKINEGVENNLRISNL